MGAYEQGFAKGVEYACGELRAEVAMLRQRSRRRHLPLAIMLAAAREMGRVANLPEVR